MAESFGLERKFCRLKGPVSLTEDMEIEGYASLFGIKDSGGDIVEKGAYTASLSKLQQAGQSVKMLWQHRPEEPIGTWDEVKETEKGLFVKGRLLPDVARAREAAALLKAGAIDGLSIGYRTVKAKKNSKGQRHLHELELWEVSLVTFPMLPEARVGAKGQEPLDTLLREIAGAFDAARAELART
ncbi:MAG: HK97 family phage prohead protease [Pseudomonadota bacterium]